jgi:crossover junction endodeoxyribonuclease RuvC
MIIGIDPGLTGAVAFYSPEDDEVLEVHDMPVMMKSKTKKKTKNQVNAVELANIINEGLDNYGIDAAVVEQVHSMPGQGVSSVFTFGESAGVIRGILAALKIQTIYVTPQKWKKAANLIGKDKDMARTLAIQMYPYSSLSRKKDIGRADAILIARFGNG